jgi:PhzF family phenazine biosynthesis protein
VSLRVQLFQVDAFTNRLFGGNPAAVVVLGEEFWPDGQLQQVAAENNLAETAFLVRSGDRHRLRWFTPTLEVPLCGHATLATGAVVLDRLEPHRDQVVFDSVSGPLTVKRTPGGYLMDLPARTAAPTPAPPGLAAALGSMPAQVLVNEHNYLAVYGNEAAVRALTPDLAAVLRLDRLGVIVTAPGEASFDFVSRYFAPAKGIPEDPVTGAAHCMLAPFWSSRLGKTELHAHQASQRGGDLVCRVALDRVELEGGCVFYLEGHINA